MKLGLLTVPFEDWTLEQVADWTASADMTALEVACWPRSGGEKRRYAGTSHIDVENLSDGEAGEIRDMLGGKGIEISGLGYYPNPLHQDEAVREASLSHLKLVIAAAPKLGVSVVNTFMGGQRDLNLDENWARAERIFPDIVAHARDHGVTLCFENCPMIFSHDEWPGGHNIAYSPRTWRRIFDKWPEGVGMNYDPSHLVWQMIDQTRFIKEFGSRIAHAHAKDLEIDRDGLYENGIMSAGMGWQIPRLCGLGDVDWSEVFGGLYRIGYDGPMIIEHEDRMFEGSDEKVMRGFLLARDVLAPYVK
ncbi:sugar phosphate isomerase/epimerase family protein [Histidinibacterium lentulum]|uniref:Sugar phosphate isomerase/epimerase n=1 Tax=Histidinibacterium lentulum TaxID=2480588 RepID=A0A3N2R527_9RHOB|nr:sugar phosphate isomerase/epimerase [Histidinibacterium lentulum]ROU02589.1 sugar phosphate isomerase/epimerase [Histidinibacterium lentulum]